jgi:hypothetical protein
MRTGEVLFYSPDSLCAIISLGIVSEEFFSRVRIILWDPEVLKKRNPRTGP